MPKLLPVRVPRSGVGAEADFPFHATLSPQLVTWMAAHKLAIAFTTCAAGRLVVIAPGRQGAVAVSAQNFGRATILCATETSLYLSTKYQVWQFEKGLPLKPDLNSWDRLYMPRRCELTGPVDIRDIQVDCEGRILVAVARYNCLAELDGCGGFTPLWKPSFIDALVNEDRCHFTGFCVESGVAAYATVTAPSNAAGGWWDMRAAGGQLIDMRDDTVIADGLAMPRAPRLHRGRLYVLEAGSGWFGTIDKKTGQFDRLAWCPGVLRGLSIVGDYAVVGLSKPRKADIAGLPLENELARRGQEPECAIYILRLSDGHFCHAQVLHKLTITGSVDELYDVAVLVGTRQPLLVGFEAAEVGKGPIPRTEISGASSLRKRIAEPQIPR